MLNIKLNEIFKVQEIDKIIKKNPKLDVLISKHKILTIPKKFLEVFDTNLDQVYLLLKVFDHWYRLEMQIHGDKNIQCRVSFPKKIYDLLKQPEKVYLFTYNKNIYAVPILNNKEDKKNE